MLIFCNMLFSQELKPSLQPKTVQLKYTPSSEVKWKMFGLNRIHIQDFGITDQYVDTCNCGESRAFLDKANVTVGMGFYNNVSKNIALSGDFGMSYGTIAKNRPTPSDKKQLWFSTIRFDTYYHFSDSRLQMRPYVFAGIHGSQRSAKSLISVPMGLGIRYMLFNNNGMITAQAGYGLGISHTLKNNITYTWGLYVKMSRKKKLIAQTPIDTCTIATPDTDSDGVEDRLDKCPTVPGSANNFGCPIIDRDLDGILDENDKCPDIAGPPINQGCPLLDKDGDGLTDKLDKCPEIAGPPSNDGCPETPQKIEASTIKDTVQYIIFFDFDKYYLTASSFQILDEVKEFLRKNNNYNLILVGHTDLEGDSSYNIKLSENRVKTAKNYLISYGIPEEKISIDFLGKSKPAIPSFDKLLAWKNRRVEIFLIKK